MTTILITYALVIIALFLPKVKPAMAFGLGALLLVLSGHLSVAEWMGALTTPSLLILITLMVLAGAAQAYLPLAQWMVRSQASPRRFLLKLMALTAAASSLMNNTAVVAMLMAPVRTWALSKGRSAAPFLMPLAFAATLGGVITVIGTSTNLVLNGLLEDNGFPILHSIDYLPIGILVTVGGIGFLSLFAFRILPDRGAPKVELRREYTVETRVVAGGGYANLSVETAGLRQLHGLYLVEIFRQGHCISPVAPSQILEANDRLFFAGDLDQVRALTQSHSGLALPQNELTDFADQSAIIEAMIPPGSNLTGSKVRDSQFRQRFDAAIVAVHRQGRRMEGKIGDLILQAGDLLLLVGGSGFDSLTEGNKHLYSLDARPPLPVLSKTSKGLSLLAAALILAGWLTGQVDFLTALVTAGAAGGALGLIRWGDVKRHLDWELMTVLVSALGFSLALMRSGAPDQALAWLQASTGDLSAITWLVMLFVATTIATNALSNIAALAILFPMVAAMVNGGVLPSQVAFLGLAFGASNAFLTPFGYQTNLLVYGPGGYKSLDYLRMGIGLTFLYGAIVLIYLQFLLP